MDAHSSFPLVLTAALAATTNLYAGGLKFEAEPSAAQEVTMPTAVMISKSDISAKFDEGFTQVEVKLKVKGGATVVGAHFHCARAGVNGPVAFGLFNPGPLSFDGKEVNGTLTNADYTGADCMPSVGRPVNNIASLALAMRDGLIYINVHTASNPSGEVRGQMLED